MKTGNANIGFGIFICISGVAVLILSLLPSLTLELKIALSFAALGIIVSGIAQTIYSAERRNYKEKYEQDKKEATDNQRQMMEKLEKIEHELEKQGQSKNTGAAIADFLGTGIKHYLEHNQEKEENND